MSTGIRRNISNRIDLIPDNSVDLIVPALVPWQLTWQWKSGPDLDNAVPIDVSSYTFEAHVLDSRNREIALDVVIEPDQVTFPGVFRISADATTARELGVGQKRWSLSATPNLASQPLAPRVVGDFTTKRI